MKQTLEQLFNHFTTGLVNDNTNCFLMYVLQKSKVKLFILDYFNVLYDKTIESDKCWFFKNCCYLYLFVNGKDCYKKLEWSKIFDCFFSSFADNKDDDIENYYGADKLEKL